MIEPDRIELVEGRSVRITWSDGRLDTFSAVELRDACGCAGCKNVARAPADPETCRITTIGLVGAYAINMVFAPDGHSTGIYPYPVLRDLGDLARADDVAP